MSNVTFDFMPQASTVTSLLNACIAALPQMPEPEKTVMVQALREFENFGVPTLWSPSDADADESLGLTMEEKREVISRFLQDHRCNDADWCQIEKLGADVLSER